MIMGSDYNIKQAKHAYDGDEPDEQKGYAGHFLWLDAGFGQMETDQLDTTINSEEDSGHCCKCADLYKHDVEDSPMGHVSTVLARQECQVSVNRMIPLKEKAMLQQTYGAGPYRHVY